LPAEAIHGAAAWIHRGRGVEESMTALEATMGDLENEIQELREKTNQMRRQLLETELQTCFIGIERAELELLQGNSQDARKEFGVASRRPKS
jgi:hypothetical protein